MEVNAIFWVGFHLIIFAILAFDLGVINKNAHKITLREALIWSGAWILLAVIFNGFIFFEFGKTKALEFLTGYLIEYSLSVDNIFVFILIFSYFAVKPQYQHKILFWGILGALIMRGIFIFAGVTLINRFHWVVLIFGGFLVFSGVKMLFQKETTSVSPEKNSLVRLFRKFLPVTEMLHDDKLVVRLDRKFYATPLFLVLLVIESTDLIFAVDSIPAILAISKDSFIVYTSNIFAILGLRSLYFAVSGIMGFFRFLKTGLALVLSFVGIKMLASYFHFEIPIVTSLAVIVSILLVSIAASVIIKEK
jgi:tellurite resistance protein TerC